MGVVNVVAYYLSFGPDHIFGIREARHFKCRLLIDTQEYVHA